MTARDYLNTNKSIYLSSSDVLLEFNTELPNFIKQVERLQYKPIPKGIVENIRKFHTITNTLTPHLELTLSKISNGCPVVKVFHQPNTFAALNIIGMLLIGELAKQQSPIEFEVLFISLDYDAAGDQRFRTPLIPNPGFADPLRLNGFVPQKKYKSLACSVGSPGHEKIDGWISSIRGSLRRFLPTLKNNSTIPFLRYNLINQEIDELFQNLRETYIANHSISFNNFTLLNWFINTKLNLHIPFVPGSWLLANSYSTMVDIVQNINSNTIEKCNVTLLELSKSLGIEIAPLEKKEIGIWKVGSDNYEREVTDVEQFNSHGYYLPETSNFLYKAEYSLFQDEIFPNFLPRVTVCDLLELISYNLPAGISYSGGIDHCIKSRIISHHLGQKSADLFWDPQNIFSDELQIQETLFSSCKFPFFVYFSLIEKEYIFSKILKSVSK